MKINKGMSVLLASMLIVSTNFKISDAVSPNTCIKKLKIGTTYKYDIDGDKDKDRIKLTFSKDALVLEINNTYKRLEDFGAGDEVVRLYNFNKKDKSYTFVYEKDRGLSARILKFKNNKCMMDKTIKNEYIVGYDDSGNIKLDGEIGNKFDEAFFKAFGIYIDIGNYRKININDYKITESKYADVDSYVKDIYFKANNTMTAYKSPTTSSKAFTVKKGDKVRIYQYYMSGSNKRIKIKNSSGKYGWIKYSGKQLFKYSYEKCKYGTYHYFDTLDCMCSKLPSSLRAKDYEITEAKMVDDGYGNTDIIGYLRNNSTSTWDYVEVMVTWYDKYGNVIDTTYDNVLNLKPNQRWKFTINTYGNCRKFKITKVTIDKW